MARDSNGVYFLPTGINPVAGGTTISSSWANPTLTDVETALTDSLDRNGRGTMNAPLPFADGVITAPGITWGQEPSSGFYRPGAGDMRVSILENDVFRWTASIPEVWVNGSWETIVYNNGPGGLPLGTAAWETITWDNIGGAWIGSGALIVNDDTGAVSVPGTISEGGTLLSNKYLGIGATAADSDLLNGVNAAFYQNSTNQNDGTLNKLRLTGSYDIDITGASATSTTATTANNANNLNNQAPSYYVDAANLTGRVPDANLSGEYPIAITGDAGSVDGYSMAVVVALPGDPGGAPGPPDANTIYFVTG